MLAVVFLVVYGMCMALSMSTWALDPLNYPDLDFYQERTTAILSGDVPYRDIQVESPPLIMYLMVPAQLMGGGLIHYAIWFSALTFLGSVSLYSLLLPVWGKAAFPSALLYLINPATVATATISIQDESVIGVLVVIALALLARGMKEGALAVSVIGMATKVFTVFLIPLVLISDRAHAKRDVLIVSLLSLAVILPFLLLAPSDFLSFPEYYLHQALGEGVSDGMSLWRFLADGGVVLPSAFFFSALLISYVVIIALIARIKPDPFSGGYLVMLPFLLFFPKVYPFYLVMALAPLSVRGTFDRRLLLSSIAIYFLGLSTMPFVTLDNAPLGTGYVWIPVLINLLLSLVMIMTAIMILTDAKGRDRQKTLGSEKDA